MKVLPIDIKRMAIFFCIFDIFGLGPFLIPGLSEMHIQTLGMIEEQLGGQSWRDVDPLGLVLAQLLGLLGIGWAVYRLRNLTKDVVFFEGWLRLCFAGLFVYAAISLSATVFWVFALLDLVAGLWHLSVLRIRDGNPQTTS